MLADGKVSWQVLRKTAQSASVQNIDLSAYLTTTAADERYRSITWVPDPPNLSAYLTTTAADERYRSISWTPDPPNLTAYLTTTAGDARYRPISWTPDPPNPQLWTESADTDEVGNAIGEITEGTSVADLKENYNSLDKMFTKMLSITTVSLTRSRPTVQIQLGTLTNTGQISARPDANNYDVWRGTNQTWVFLVSAHPGTWSPANRILSGSSTIAHTIDLRQATGVYYVGQQNAVSVSNTYSTESNNTITLNDNFFVLVWDNGTLATIPAVPPSSWSIEARVVYNDIAVLPVFNNANVEFGANEYDAASKNIAVRYYDKLIKEDEAGNMTVLNIKVYANTADVTVEYAPNNKIYVPRQPTQILGEFNGAFHVFQTGVIMHESVDLNAYDLDEGGNGIDNASGITFYPVSVNVFTAQDIKIKF